MNKLWSEKNKEMQTLISKEATFDAGVDKLISLRNILFKQTLKYIMSYLLMIFVKCHLKMRMDIIVRQ